MDAAGVPAAGAAASSCAARASIPSAAPPSAAPSARLIADYEARLDEIVATLAAANHADAIALAAVPLDIRGFGHVKEANWLRAQAKDAALAERFRAAAGPPALAAE